MYAAHNYIHFCTNYHITILHGSHVCHTPLVTKHLLKASLRGVISQWPRAIIYCIDPYLYSILPDLLTTAYLK